MNNYITKSGADNWKPLTEEGVNTRGIYVKVLHFDNIAERASTFLLKFEPGASYPFHNHPGGEEAFVMEGEVYFNDHLMEKGDYLYTPPNFTHSVRTDKGCVIFFKVPQEVEIIRNG